MNSDITKIFLVCGAYVILIIFMAVIFVVAKAYQPRVQSSQVVVSDTLSSCTKVCKKYSMVTNKTFVCDKNLAPLQEWNFEHSRVVGFGPSGPVIECDDQLPSASGCICHEL